MIKGPLTASDRTIAAYRTCLKSWTSVVAGLEAGDEAALLAELERMEPLLARIAEESPAQAYTVDILVNARRRGYATPDEDRPDRPPERGSRS